MKSILRIRRSLYVLLMVLLAVLLNACDSGSGGGGGPGAPSPSAAVTILGTVDDGTPNSPISNAKCAFVDLNGDNLGETSADTNGNFSINVLPEEEGHIRCYPPGIKKLILSTYSSTKGRSAGDKISGDDVTPPTTVVADIINSENPEVPQARKIELLNAIENDEDPGLSLLVDLSTRLYKAMLDKQIDVRFGGDDGIDGPGEGPGGGGGVGGDAGDGAYFSPIPNARCEFVAMELEGDDLFAPDLKKGEVLFDAALADFCNDGMVDRPDLEAIAEQVNQAFEGRQTEIMAAIAKYFSESECIGQPYPYRTTADDEDSETPGRYFLPIPPNLQGFVRCTPANQPELKLATFVSTEDLAEGEKLGGQDVKPETTFFSNNIADKLYDDLSTVKENYLEDIAGLGLIRIIADGEKITRFELQDTADPMDDDVGLVAFSATSLFNILFKNGEDVDYLAALDGLIEKKEVDPEDLKKLGIPEDDAKNWSEVVNDSNDDAGEDLGTDLNSALSTARIKVTVLDRPREDEGKGIPGAEVDITKVPSGVECEDCPGDTDDNGEVTLTLTGVDVEAIQNIEVEASPPETESFEPTKRTTRVVAFATVDLDIAVSYKLTVQGDGNGNGTVTSIPSGISCDISGGVASGDDSKNYEFGTEVTLTADPLEDSTFNGWSGGCSGTGDCTVTMNQAHTVIATFKLKESGSLEVTIAPSAAVSAGAQWRVTGDSWRNNCV